MRSPHDTTNEPATANAPAVSEAQRGATGVNLLAHEARAIWPMVIQGIRLMAVLLVVCGVLYPALLFAIGQIAFPSQANGSLVRNARGQIIGSALIGQQFVSPYYFHGRPSAVGYNASGSGGSNLGPLNPQLLYGNGMQVTVAPGAPPPAGSTPVPGHPNTYIIPGSYLGVQNYAAQFRAENGLAPDTPLPADIVTASGSGLDPNISVAAAELQVDRAVAARSYHRCRSAGLDRPGHTGPPARLSRRAARQCARAQPGARRSLWGATRAVELHRWAMRTRGNGPVGEGRHRHERP
jgi:potassium-transporting ATPase KdpC subunit